MPTKRNYGGEQQNYVPKGNEAGGQWGDDETGSNVNWKNPNAKESKLTQGVKKGLGESVGVQVEPTQKKGVNDIGKTIEGSKLDKKTKNSFKDAWEGGNETSRKIINAIPKKVDVEFKKYGDSFFNGTMRSASISEGIFEYEGWRDKQEVMFHELGHAVDMLYCEGYQTTTQHIRGLEDYEAFERKTLSYSYKTSTGKTLNETLIEELSQEKRKQIVEDYKNELSYRGIHDMREVNAKYADLSDMCEACGGGKKTYGYAFSGYCHGSAYWKQSSDKRAKEFFAEAFSSKSSSNKERYELIKKYLPNTCKAFDEIYDVLSKANGKYVLGENKND